MLQVSGKFEAVFLFMATFFKGEVIKIFAG
jgi:hypothetical protein